MANTVTSQTLLDGSKRSVIKWYLASDGASGELADQVIFDASAMTPATTDSTIERIRGYFIGFSGLVEFDATTDVAALVLPADDQFDFDFTNDVTNGLPNNSGTGKTGDILLTTTGFTAATDIGWLEITVRKD